MRLRTTVKLTKRVRGVVSTILSPTCLGYLAVWNTEHYETSIVLRYWVGWIKELGGPTCNGGWVDFGRCGRGTAVKRAKMITDICWTLVSSIEEGRGAGLVKNDNYDLNSL